MVSTRLRLKAGADAHVFTQNIGAANGSEPGA